MTPDRLTQARKESVQYPQEVRALVDKAKEDALQRIDNRSPEARDRVVTAIENRFAPAVKEAHRIAEQLISPEYVEYHERTSRFLGCFWGRIACPDGRIRVSATGDPNVVNNLRTLEGIPDVRISNGEFIPSHPEIVAAIRNYVQNQKDLGVRTPEIVEFIGPHGNSVDPLHGCGGGIGSLIESGHAPENSALMGGIKEYFDRTNGKGEWDAFDNLARSCQVIGTTIDEWHDAHTQGLVFGLRNAHKKFNERYTLRENIDNLADKGLVLMTERLASTYRDMIVNIFSSLLNGNVELLDIEDYTKFASNNILIGSVAQQLTIMEEQRDFPFIPYELRIHKSDKALRALAYNALRNACYIVLSDIKPGEHSLLHHPEQLIRLGPIGADFNVKTIAFIQATSGGNLNDTDMSRLVALYRLMYTTHKEQGISLVDESRIIRVTAAHNPDIYVDAKEEKKARLSVEAQLEANADIVRRKFDKSIRTGETLVIACIHHPKTRKLTHTI
jgi:hypothetical protein